MAAAFRPVNLHSPLASESNSSPVQNNLTDASPSPSPGPGASGVSVNLSINPGASRNIMTPSPPTPRPSTAPQPPPAKHLDDAVTPTRANFPQNVAGQQPLPSSPFPQSALNASASAARTHGESRMQSRDSMEMDMDDSDGETNPADDGAVSDDESVNADGTRSNKKKKSQRFYCTDYPPCNLSFTRSEHLARHIR